MVTWPWLFRPPVFDGPTSRGLFDPKSGAMWIVDSFACFTTGSLDADELLEANVSPELLLDVLLLRWPHLGRSAA